MTNENYDWTKKKVEDFYYHYLFLNKEIDKTKLNKNHFKYYCLALGLIFLLKLNIKSGLTLLALAFLEGIFVKIYENISLDNLYSYDNNHIINYLITEELIFFTSKSLIMLLFLILNLNIYTIMYINIIGIIISGFFIKEKSNN